MLESSTSLIEFQRLSSIYFTMFGNATVRLLSTLWLLFIAFLKHRRQFCNLHVLTKNGKECFLLFHWTPQNPLNFLVCWSMVKGNQMAAIPADNAIINVDRERILSQGGSKLCNKGIPLHRISGMKRLQLVNQQRCKVSVELWRITINCLVFFLIRGLRKNQNVSVLLGKKLNIRLKGFKARVRIIKIYRKKCISLI